MNPKDDQPGKRRRTKLSTQPHKQYPERRATGQWMPGCPSPNPRTGLGAGQKAGRKGAGQTEAEKNAAPVPTVEPPQSPEAPTSAPATTISREIATLANPRRIARAIARAANRGEPAAIQQVLRALEQRETASGRAPSGSLKRLTVAELGVLKVLVAKSEGREHPASTVATALLSLAIETLRPDLCSAGISYLAARVAEFIHDYVPGKTKAAVLSIVAPNVDDAEAPPPETAEVKPPDARRSSKVTRTFKPHNRRK